MDAQTYGYWSQEPLLFLGGHKTFPKGGCQWSASLDRHGIEWSGGIEVQQPSASAFL